MPSPGKLNERTASIIAIPDPIPIIGAEHRLRSHAPVGASYSGLRCG